ncbi:MAG: type II toxin-antitoxin system VapC family toxin [Ideonella sp.]|nr:type II toxin-antitoxin system VapC family toxin [Ideonella sp.]MBL0151349.1 type II toxin-antitoxin system VapC family toxin [Ideonella sp.]
MPFVLDNSVVSGWYLKNQATPYTAAIAERLLDDRAWAPAVWELELANVLRTACMRQRMVAQQAQQVLARIAQLPVDVDRQAVPPSELLALAIRFGLSSYDAAYLELALRRQLPLATQDDALRAAALASGVGCVEAS